MVGQNVQDLPIGKQPFCGGNHHVPAAEDDLEAAPLLLVDPLDTPLHRLHEGARHLLPGAALHGQFVQPVEQDEEARFALPAIQRVEVEAIPIAEEIGKGLLNIAGLKVEVVQGHE